MAYITNENGEVKVIDAKGKTKWLIKRIAENAKVMQNCGLTIMEAPESFEPKFNTESVLPIEQNESVDQFQQDIEIHETEATEDVYPREKRAYKKRK